MILCSRIIFNEYVFVNEMINKINEINKNENNKCEFKNISGRFYFYDNEYCYGELSPTTVPSPRPPLFEFINSRVELREQLAFKYSVSINDSGIGFVYGGNNNKNFYDIIFDCGELSPHTPAPPRPTAIVFNGIDTGISGIDILESIFGVDLCQSNGFNGICNEMINGM